MKHLLNLSVFSYMAHKTIKVSDAVCRIEKVTPLLNGYRITAECNDTRQAFGFELEKDPGSGSWIILSGEARVNPKEDSKPYYHIHDGEWTFLELNNVNHKRTNPFHSRWAIETVTILRSLNQHWGEIPQDKCVEALRGIRFIESILLSEIQKMNPVTYETEKSLLTD